MLGNTFLPAGSASADQCSPTKTTSGYYTVVTFTSGGCGWTRPTSVTSVDVLVVGGGGGGAGGSPSNAQESAASGGGGGGGTVVWSAGYAVSGSLVYDIAVGGGGAGGSAATAGQYNMEMGQPGGASSFGSLTASGGGPGYRASGTSGAANVQAGYGGTSGWTDNGTSASSSGGSPNWDASGGGAGAYGAGGNGNDLSGLGGHGGAGGPGVARDITGSVAYYGGGGGGGGVSNGSDGNGGAGGSTSSGGRGGGHGGVAVAGTNGLGGGGGGGGRNAASSTDVAKGAGGGSGVVILRYQTARSLVVTRGGTTAKSGNLLTQQPVVAVRDESGNTLTSYNGTITVSGPVAGTTSVTAVNGVGTFTDLVVTGSAGSSSTLTFTTAGLPENKTVYSDVWVPAPTSPTITTQPGSATTISGETATFSVAASITDLGTVSYQWQKSTNGGTSWSDISGANASSYTTPAASYSSPEVQFRARVTNTLSGGTALTYSNAATLTVKPGDPTVSVPAAVIQTEGQTLTLTATATPHTSEDVLSYRWFKGATVLNSCVTDSCTVASAAVSGDAGSYSVDVAATAVGQTTTKTSSAISVTIDPAPIITTTTLPEGWKSVAYTHTLAANTSNLGGRWALSFGSLPAGLALNASTGVISGTPATAGPANTFTVTYTDRNGAMTSQSYTVGISELQPAISSEPMSVAKTAGQTAIFSVNASVAHGDLDYQWQQKSGGGWDDLTGETGSSLTLLNLTTGNAGDYRVLVAAHDVPGNVVASATATLTVVAKPTVTTASLEKAQVGSAYASTLAGVFGTSSATWSITGGTLPTSLSLSSSGLISGTPVASDPGSYVITVIVQDGNGVASVGRQLNLVITPETPDISSLSTATGVTVGQSFTLSVTATVGSGDTAHYQWFHGTQQVGADSASYTVNSAASADAGSYTVQVTATRNSQSASVTSSAVAVTVDSAPSISTTALTPGWRGKQQTWTLAGSAADGTWSVASGALPSGLTLSGASITGIPTAAGTGSFSIRLTDRNNASVDRQLTLAIAEPSVDTPSLTGGQVGQAYSRTLAASYGTSTVTWAETGGLPAGMSFADGVLSGTPTQAGTFNVSVTVTDANGITSAARSLTLHVAPGEPMLTGPSATSATVGGLATFTVATTPYSAGDQLTYEWRRDGSPVSGAAYSTNAAGYQLTISPVAVAHDGAYTVRVTATAGGLSTTVGSAPAALDVVAQTPQLDPVQPELEATPLLGASVTFSPRLQAVTDGGTLSYVWKHNGQVLSSQTGATLTVADITEADNGNYTVRVINSLNGHTAHLDVAVGGLTVQESGLPTITVQPTDPEVGAGEIAQLSVTATGSGILTYQWQERASGQWSDLTNATAANYATGVLSGSDPSRHYRVKVTATEANKVPVSVYSDSATVTVHAGSPQPQPGWQPNDSTPLLGSSIAFSAGVQDPPADGGSLSYQWFRNGQPISGATDSAWTVDPFGADDAGSYTVVVTNTLPNGQQTTLEVEAGKLTASRSVVPSITRQPASANLIVGKSAGLEVAASASAGILTYQWQRSAGSGWAAIAGATAAEYVTPLLALSDSGLKYRVVVTNTEAGKLPASATSNAAGIRVKAPATVPSAVAEPDALPVTEPDPSTVADPSAVAEPEPPAVAEPDEAPSSDPSSGSRIAGSGWPWLLAVIALTAGGGFWAWRRRNGDPA